MLKRLECSGNVGIKHVVVVFFPPSALSPHGVLPTVMSGTTVSWARHRFDSLTLHIITCVALHRTRNVYYTALPL